MKKKREEGIKQLQQCSLSLKSVIIVVETEYGTYFDKCFHHPFWYCNFIFCWWDMEPAFFILGVLFYLFLRRSKGGGWRRNWEQLEGIGLHGKCRFKVKFCGEGLDFVLNPGLIKKIRLRIRCIHLEIWASYIIVEPTDSNVSRSLGTLVGALFFSCDLTSLGWPNHGYISSQAYPKINELQIDGLFMPRIFQILSL